MRRALGPRADGTSAETGLLDSWPTNGPPLVWDKAIGTGYSAPSVRGNLLVLHHRLGKLVEIGTIYTTVAGLLNVLAIYDALEGPAFVEGEEPAAATPSLTPTEAIQAGGSA